LAYKTGSNIRQKYDLGIELKKVEECSKLCEELKDPIYWKKLGDLAL